MPILIYGKDIKTEFISDLQLKFKGKCKCSHYNVGFVNERPTIYWIIPTGAWKTKKATIYCSKCEKYWDIDDSQKKITDFYKEVKESLDSETNQEFNLNLKITPHFQNLPKEEQEKLLEEARKEDDESFLKMLKFMGLLLGIGALVWIVLKLFFIKGL